jgi:hypothetical protein
MTLARAGANLARPATTRWQRGLAAGADGGRVDAHRVVALAYTAEGLLSRHFRCVTSHTLEGPDNSLAAPAVLQSSRCLLQQAIRYSK